MRIFFFPYYYYLQYDPFFPVIKHLNAAGIDAQLVYISNISPKDETSIYQPERFCRDGIPFQEFRLQRLRRTNDRPAPLSQLPQYLLNFYRLKAFIRRMKPDEVVIGSHLGGIYIRALQIICHQLQIFCFCFWGIEVKGTNSTRVPVWMPIPHLIKSTLHWPPDNAYTRNHRFGVSGNALKRHLMEKGISESQIVVTGNPAHDAIQRVSKQDTCRVMPDRKMDRGHIIFLSEVIQEIFGLDYLERLLKSLGAACDELPVDIKVVVKFHPRETLQTRALHRDILTGDRYTFCETTDLADLIRRAALSIGCFTKALETSFILGVPVLSINFTGKNEYSIIYPTDKRMECANPDELKTKLAAFFGDPEFRKTAHEVMTEWLAENVYALDGRSTQRMADAIIAHAGQRRGIVCG